MLSYRIANEESAVRALAPAWRALQDEIGLSPFTDPDFILLWFEASGKPQGAVLFIVSCWEEDKLVGLLPLAVAPKGGVRVLRYAGHDVFYMRNSLVRDADVGAALWAQVRAGSFYDFADIKNAHEGSPEADFFTRKALFVQEGPVYYRAFAKEQGLLAPYTKRLRRKLQKVEDAVLQDGGFSWGVSRDASLLEEAVPFLVEQKSLWCLKKGKSGVFDQASVEAFYRAFASHAAASGLLRLVWMRRQGRLVALMLCLAFKGTLYAHTMAYSEEVMAFTPGFFLNLIALRDAQEEGLAEMNFMEGSENFKERFSTDARRVREYVFARSLKGVLFLLAYVGRQKFRLLRARAT